MRRTKIVATLGPACDPPGVIEALVGAGLDVARLGLAHGSMEDHLERVRRVREAAERAGRVVAVLVDLPGPKVRTGAFPGDGVVLTEGHPLELVSGEGPSDADVVTVEGGVLEGAEPGDEIVLGDGVVLLRVTGWGAASGAGSRDLEAEVVRGGSLRGRPGFHLPGRPVKVDVPTEEDIALLDQLADAGADVEMVAVSFVQSGEDMRRAREVLGGLGGRLGEEYAAGPEAGAGDEPEGGAGAEHGGAAGPEAGGVAGPLLVAKVETAAAVADLDAVVAASDAVMVARGDLGVQLPLEEVPHLQKRIIRSCLAQARPVITATQMLESMTTAPSPTRAEATDVANAVIDGTDALMLSGETAIGHDPVAAVRTMARIGVRAEQEEVGRVDRRRDGRRGHERGDLPLTDAMAHAANEVALDAGVAAILCCTRTGATVRAMSRYRPRVPLIGLTPHLGVLRQMAATWGVVPVAVPEYSTTDQMVANAVAASLGANLVRPGDVVAVLAGAPTRGELVTDTLRLVRV